MEGKLEFTAMPTLHLNVFSSKFEFGFPVEEEKVVVDPSYFFATCPILIEQFNEDIC